MGSENSISDTREDAIRESIDKIVKEIKEVEDPDELNRYRRMIRRSVPVFLRSYFTAYLFKRSVSEIPVKPEAFTTLFFSIGKNRKVFPKDLIELITKNLHIGRAEIGEIKVLDNYSFVDVSLDHASNAMSKLSGMKYRGRRIRVNLARKKGEEKS